MDALDRERHGRAHPGEEADGVAGGLAGEEAGYLPARAVVDGIVLVEAAGDLADVHLDAVAGDGAAVAPGTLAAQPGSSQLVLAVADQHLVDGVRDEPEPMLADQLDAQTLDTELAGLAQLENERLLTGEDLPPG